MFELRITIDELNYDNYITPFKQKNHIRPLIIIMSEWA